MDRGPLDAIARCAGCGCCALVVCMACTRRTRSRAARTDVARCAVDCRTARSCLWAREGVPSCSLVAIDAVQSTGQRTGGGQQELGQSRATAQHSTARSTASDGSARRTNSIGSHERRSPSARRYCAHMLPRSIKARPECDTHRVAAAHERGALRSQPLDDRRTGRRFPLHALEPFFRVCPVSLVRPPCGLWGSSACFGRLCIRLSARRRPPPRCTHARRRIQGADDRRRQPVQSSSLLVHDGDQLVAQIEAAEDSIEWRTHHSNGESRADGRGRDSR